MKTLLSLFRLALIWLALMAALIGTAAVLAEFDSLHIDQSIHRSAT
jgi:uncharacterized membrane protein